MKERKLGILGRKVGMTTVFQEDGTSGSGVIHPEETVLDQRAGTLQFQGPAGTAVGRASGKAAAASLARGLSRNCPGSNQPSISHRSTTPATRMIDSGWCLPKAASR